MTWKTSKREFIYKLYRPQSGAASSEIFLRTLTDVESTFDTEFSLYGGLGPLTLRFSKRIDELPSDLTFNNRIRIYVKDDWNSTPKLIYYGYIVSLDPTFREGEEGTGVTLLGAISKLQNDFLRTGDDLSFEVSPGTIGSHIQSIINNYRSYVPNSSMISNDYSLIADTTEVGNIPYRFFNLKHLEAIKEISKFLPKNDAEGKYWIWYLNPEGKFVLRKLSTTTDHTLFLRKNIIEISLRKNIENTINKVFFWNEKGASSPEYVHKVYEDTTSQSSYDIISEEITDSAISTVTQADLFGQGKLKEMKDVQAEATVRVDASTYDIFSFKPGDLVKIRDIKTANLFPDRMIITKIRWTEDEATLELSTPRPDITTQVEKDRKYVEEQLRWFGKILTNIDGTRISSGLQHWTAEGLVWSYPAYNRVDWTSATFHLPDGVRRVITSGTTGSMTSDLYLYIDEKNKWCAKDIGETTPSTSGTGSISKGGDTLLDSSKAWTTDQWKGYVLIVNPGASEERHIIRGNTTTTLTVETDDKFDLTTGSYSYEVWKFALRTTTSISNLSFEDQIVISLAKVNPDTSAPAINVPSVSSVLNGSSLEEGSNRALSGFDDNSFIRKIIKGSILPTAVSQNPTLGLNLTKDYLGYYDGTSPYSPSGWKVYIDNTGKYYFKGDANNYIQWDGSALTVSGSISVTGGNAVKYDSATDKIKHADGTTVLTGELNEETNLRFVTDNEKIGAGRGYNALNASNRYKQWLASTEMTAASGLSGQRVEIDSGGIRGYNSSGIKTFEITGNEGNAYFRGNIGASTISGTIQVTSANQIAFFDASNQIAAIYASGGDMLIYGTQTTSDIFLQSGSSGTIGFAPGGSIKSYIDSSYALVANANLMMANYRILNLGSPVSSTDAATKGYVDGRLYLSYLGIDTTKSWGGYGISGLGTLTPYSSSYDLGSSSYYWNNLYLNYLRFNPGSGYGKIYWGTDTLMEIYAAEVVFRKHFRPPSSTGYNLGASGQKWQYIYSANVLQSCPLPTQNSAIATFKKIKSPKIMKSQHYGERWHFEDEDFPEEMKCKDDSGKKVFEHFRGLGITIQAIRELILKVEALEEKYEEISKKIIV